MFHFLEVFFGEKYLWEKEWHSIKFKELGIKLSKTALPRNDFYKKFYSKLKLKYKRYGQLNKNWLKEKKITALKISTFLEKKRKILSYGCGIGYIEFNLAKIKPKINIDCFDFSDDCKNFLNKESFLANLNFQKDYELFNNSHYDFIYLCQVCYSLDKKSCISLFKDLHGKLNKEGSFLIIHHPPFKTFKSKLIYFVKFLLSGFNSNKFLNKKKEKNEFQFWGYQRSDNAYIKLARDASFTLDKKYYYKNQSYLLFIKSS